MMPVKSAAAMSDTVIFIGQCINPSIFTDKQVKLNLDVKGLGMKELAKNP